MGKLTYESWTTDFTYPQAVLDTRYAFNELGSARAALEAVPVLKQFRDKNGVAVTVIGKHNTSQNEALALLLPFANRIGKSSVHNLLRAGFIYETLNRAGFGDTSGVEIPVVALSSPLFR